MCIYSNERIQAGAMSDLSEKVCPKCGNKAVEVLNLETWIRTGWFCLNPDCKGYEVSIGRERKINDYKKDKQ